MHFLIPFIDYPEIFSIRAKVHKLPTETPSKDLQMISIAVRVLYRPDAENLPNIYRQLGKDYDVRVINSIVPEVLKSTVSQFDSYQLVNQREQVSMLIKKQLSERARNFWMLIDDVSITDLNFGADYLKAVEEKQVALQQTEKAKFIVEMAKQTKEDIIVKAKGDALSATLINNQISQDPDRNFLTLRRIEAAKEIASLLSQSNNRVMLSSDNLLFNQIFEKK